MAIFNSILFHSFLNSSDIKSLIPDFYLEGARLYVSASPYGRLGGMVM